MRISRFSCFLNLRIKSEKRDARTFCYWLGKGTLFFFYLELKRRLMSVVSSFFFFYTVSLQRVWNKTDTPESCEASFDKSSVLCLTLSDYILLSLTFIRGEKRKKNTKPHSHHCTQMLQKKKRKEKGLWVHKRTFCDQHEAGSVTHDTCGASMTLIRFLFLPRFSSHTLYCWGFADRKDGIGVGQWTRDMVRQGLWEMRGRLVWSSWALFFGVLFCCLCCRCCCEFDF